MSQEDFDLLKTVWNTILTEESWIDFQQDFADRKAEVENRASRNQRRTSEWDVQLPGGGKLDISPRGSVKLNKE